MSSIPLSNGQSGGTGVYELAGLNRDDVSFLRSGGSFVVEIKASQQQFRIPFSSPTDRIEFANGETLYLNSIQPEKVLFEGSSAANAISAVPPNEYAFVPALVIPGRGDDTIRDGHAPTYRFKAGDGNDRIVSFYPLGTGTFEFGPGITASQIAFSVVTITGDPHLRLDYAPGDSISIDIRAQSSLGATLKFDDGTEVSLAHLIRNAGIAATSITGTAGFDELIDGLGADTISAGAGNDVISLRFGDNTVDGGAGNDYILDGAGDDTLLFAVGMGAGSGADGIPSGWWY